MAVGATNVQIARDAGTGSLRVQATLEFPDGTTAPFDRTLAAYQYDILRQFVAMAPTWTFHGVTAPDDTDVAHVLLAIQMPFLWTGPAATEPPVVATDDLVMT